VQKALLFLIVFSSVASLFLVLVTRIVFRKNSLSPQSTSEKLPPVSVLKPLRGEDPELEQNLEPFFQQDYQEYEIIFACEDTADPALRVVQALQKRFPQLPVKVKADKTSYGYNPKVNNLIRAYSVASYGIILTGDSDVRPPRNYLRTIVTELLKDNNKMVVNPIYGRGDNSLGSILETLHLNSLILSGIALLTIYRKKLAGFGKSMLFRKSDLETAGGFIGLKDFFAEDYVLADRIARLPGECHIARILLPCITSQRSLQQFINRHGRWAQARRRIAGWSYVSELLANPIWWGLLYLAVNLFSGAGVKVFLSCAIFKILLDGYQGVTIAKNRQLATYLLVPLKDLLTGIIWFYPLVTDTVYWRGVRLRVTAGTELKEAGRRKILGVRLPKISIRRWLRHSDS
jgi:ceramide glucosyltransferase